MVVKSVLNEADRLLLENNIKTIPLSFTDLKNIAKNKGWTIITYQQGQELIGVLKLSDYIKSHYAITLKHNGENIIMYNNKLSYEGKIHCICHEFGHIVLEHTEDSYVVGYSSDAEIQSKQEQEAEAFAAEMSAPICFMKKTGIKTIDDLIKTGLLSKEQAILHVENMKLNSPKSDIEIALYNQIVPIKNTKYRKNKKIWLAILSIICAILIIGFITIKCISNNKLSKNFEMVYITVNGKSYHIENCYHIQNKDNLICISSTEAKTSGYKPCRDCIVETDVF